MATTSYKFPGTTASETISGGNAADWGDHANIAADDAAVAVYDISTASEDQSAYLKGSNFGFTTGDIPSGSTIDGIEVEYQREEGGNTDNISTNRMRAIKGGVISSSNVSTMNTTEWDNSVETITEGGATNLWGETWADTDITSSEFGIALAADCAGTTPDAFVDYIKCRIHYTTVAGGSFQAAWAAGSNEVLQ